MASTETAKGALSGTKKGPRPIKALVPECIDGVQEEGTASVLESTSRYSRLKYAIKACIMENIENGYTGRNINILSDDQAAIKALESFQINSKLVWDCHQSLVKLAEFNLIQLVWVPGHMEINGNAIADDLAIQP